MTVLAVIGCIWLAFLVVPIFFYMFGELIEFMLPFAGIAFIIWSVVYAFRYFWKA